MVLYKLPVPGRPTIWIKVGQGPTALAVGVAGGCLTILLSSILSLLFLPLFGRLPNTSQRALKPKTTNQPTKICTKLMHSADMHRKVYDRVYTVQLEFYA